MTGRKGRIMTGRKGRILMNMDEKDKFMKGEKKIAIISEAAFSEKILRIFV
ncbi:unnamed protein product [Heligmosomoides polygyrus]|uniref:Transcriptional regulator n=1 Tax=Heligmosomoides polygyrus TaxID=6339 RepID=A0A183GIQ5_HELPZ|nr:unnamed protein product [Heligmosomoides polygyrus]